MATGAPHPPKLGLSLTSEYPEVPYDAEKDLLVMASVKAPANESDDNRPPLDLVCVIDRSGSMSGDRLRLVLRSVNFIIKNLKDSDCMSVVSYDDTVQVVCPFTKMDGDGKKIVRQKVDGVSVGGMTNLIGGLLQGLDEMRKRPNAEGRVRTLMLFTDGEANVGYTTTEEIIKATIDRSFARKSDGCQFLSANQPQAKGKKPSVFSRMKGMFQKNAPAEKQVHSDPSTWDHEAVIAYLEGLQLGKQKGAIIESFRAEGITGEELMEVTDKGQSHNWLEKDMGVTNKLHRVRILKGIEPGEDDESKTAASDEETLPCAIYTFGFGRDHSATLLSGLAEHGNGVYYFIDTVKQIAVIFRDCLGGLTTTMSEQIVLTLEMEKSEGEGEVDGKVVDVLNTAFNKKKLTDFSYEVTIGDMQSEETRDILFKTKVPKLTEANLKGVYVSAQINYLNLQSNKNEVVSARLVLPRPKADECKEADTLNLGVNRQSNRICAATAISAASQLAETGDLDSARKTIEQAKEVIDGSKTGKEEKSQELIRNLRHCEEGLGSQRRFRVRGAQIMKGYQQSHAKQRVALPQYDKSYANEGRMKLYEASDSSDSDEDADYGGNESPNWSESEAGDGFDLGRNDSSASSLSAGSGGVVRANVNNSCSESSNDD